jgi:hypothetical protein
MDERWLPVYVSLLTPIATLAIVMVGFLYNNSRLGELSQGLNRRMDDLSRSVDLRINDLRDLLRAEMAKNHSEMLMKFAELDSRLTRIESHMNLR